MLTSNHSIIYNLAHFSKRKLLKAYWKNLMFLVSSNEEVDFLVHPFIYFSSKHITNWEPCI